VDGFSQVFRTGSENGEREASGCGSGFQESPFIKITKLTGFFIFIYSKITLWQWKYIYLKYKTFNYFG
jgi:hypothetical protein